MIAPPRFEMLFGWKFVPKGPQPAIACGLGRIDFLASLARNRHARTHATKKDPQSAEGDFSKLPHVGTLGFPHESDPRGQAPIPGPFDRQEFRQAFGSR